MDENENMPILHVSMGMPEVTMIGTALSLVITTAALETAENPCATEEDVADLLVTLESKMHAMEMFATLSRAMGVPEEGIQMMLDKLAEGDLYGDTDEEGE
jgi:hypothetical protein